MSQRQGCGGSWETQTHVDVVHVNLSDSVFARSREGAKRVNGRRKRRSGKLETFGRERAATKCLCRTPASPTGLCRDLCGSRCPSPEGASRIYPPLSLKVFKHGQIALPHGVVSSYVCTSIQHTWQYEMCPRCGLKDIRMLPLPAHSCSFSASHWDLACTRPRSEMRLACTRQIAGAG